MSTKEWLDRVFCGMVRQRAPLGYARRVKRELCDHLEDLCLENRSSQMPDQIMGDPEVLSDSLFKSYCQSTFGHRHPALVFLLTPSIVFIALTLFTIRGLDFLFLEHLSLQASVTTCFLVLLILGTLLNVLYLCLSYQYATSFLWPIVGCLQVYGITLMTISSVSIEGVSELNTWFEAQWGWYLCMAAVCLPLSAVAFATGLFWRQKQALRSNLA